VHDGWQLEPQKGSLGDDDDETFFAGERASERTLPMNIFRFIHTGARAATQHDEPDAKREIAKMGSRRGA
jgi:hypothetical protein